MIPPRFKIGYDQKADASRFPVTEGVVVVPSNVVLDAPMRLAALTHKNPPETTRLYLVRHGQVADGHTQRYHGNNDIDLSPRPGSSS